MRVEPLSGPIVPTFAYYSLAAMLGLVAITTTNLVDGAFVGNFVGSGALASVSLLIPCFTVLFAVALMLAIGGSVGAGMHIGNGDVEGASAVFSQTLIATLVFASAFAIASHGFEGPLFRLLNVPEELLPLVREYFGVIRWALVLQLSTMVLYYFVRADGHPVLATTALVVGSLCNVGFDALFVIHFELGLRGSAYGTAVSQVIQAGVLCTYFLSKERTLRFVPWQTRWSHLFRSTYNGVAEFINEISAGVIIWLLNDTLLSHLGVEGVAAFSVVHYFVFLSLMMSYGIADALHLLVSQNYGAGHRERIRGFFRAALVCSLSLGAALALTVMLGRHAITRLFLTASEADVAAHAAELVLVVWPLFLVNVTNVILSCYLTAVQRPGPAACIAMLRGLLLPASLLMLLPLLIERWAHLTGAGSDTFLSALPIAEWLTFGVGVALCYRYRPAVLDLQPAPHADDDHLVMQAL